MNNTLCHTRIYIYVDGAKTISMFPLIQNTSILLIFPRQLLFFYCLMCHSPVLANFSEPERRSDYWNQLTRIQNMNCVWVSEFPCIRMNEIEIFFIADRRTRNNQNTVNIGQDIEPGAISCENMSNVNNQLKEKMLTK